MFIMTAKFDKKKAVALVLILGLVLTAIILVAGGASKAAKRGNEPDPNTNEGRVAFLEARGWLVDPEPLECQNIVIPREFSEVYDEYNLLQTEQGFDLTLYAGSEAVRYTYSVNNYPDLPTDVVADIIVCEGRVIAGDVQCRALDGFMHGLDYPET